MYQNISLKLLISNSFFSMESAEKQLKENASSKYPQKYKIMNKVAKMSRYCKKGETERRVELIHIMKDGGRKTKLSPWGYKYSLDIRRVKWIERNSFSDWALLK